LPRLDFLVAVRPPEIGLTSLRLTANASVIASITVTVARLSTAGVVTRTISVAGSDVPFLPPTSVRTDAGYARTFTRMWTKVRR